MACSEEINLHIQFGTGSLQREGGRLACRLQIIQIVSVNVDFVQYCLIFPPLKLLITTIPHYLPLNAIQYSVNVILNSTLNC